MSLLITWPDDDPATTVRQTSEPAEINATLQRIGCRFERLDVQPGIGSDAAQEDVLDAYRAEVKDISTAEGFVTVDVAAIHPSDDPGWPAAAKALRAKFIDEHTHGDDDEVRFMVRGAGTFFVHIGDKVHAVYATAGDLLAVPRGTTHWFDTGPVPDFTAIRFFHNPEGWISIPTGSDIAGRFPDFDAVRARAATLGAG